MNGLKGKTILTSSTTVFSPIARFPDPWWIFKGPSFTIVPGNYAVTRHSWFYFKKVPLLYAPYFYKSLKKAAASEWIVAPRRRQQLDPRIHRRPRVLLGIGRTYDLTYRGTYYTGAGLAQLRRIPQAEINQRIPISTSTFSASKPAPSTGAPRIRACTSLSRPSTDWATDGRRAASWIICLHSLSCNSSRNPTTRLFTAKPIPSDSSPSTGTTSASTSSPSAT